MPKYLVLIFLLICWAGTGAAQDVQEGSTAITGVVITNVGGSGNYEDVVQISEGGFPCPDVDAACVKEDVCVSGSLAPFDEEVSLVFRGPMNIHNIAWYEGDESSLTRTSRWKPTKSVNTIFMKNLGGLEGCAGSWTPCGGNTQTYADSTGVGCAKEPTQFTGKLQGDMEVNMMTSEECASQSQCGYYRGVGMRGWAGGPDGTKMVVFQVDMPHCGEEGFDSCAYDRPAIWALNAKILRTTQYGCNCRSGSGGNGGCGEFDVLEAIVGFEYSDMLFTSVYDFKGTGRAPDDLYFPRPMSPTHYAAIFRGSNDSYLEVVQLDDWDYSEKEISQSGSLLDGLRDQASGPYDIYGVDSREVDSCGDSDMCSKRGDACDSNKDCCDRKGNKTAKCMEGKCCSKKGKHCTLDRHCCKSKGLTCNKEENTCVKA
ncbi:unnamed protein product [Discosporangium mesarthrocarpum]